VQATIRPARRPTRPRIIVRRALLALVLLAGWRCADAEAASLSPLLRDLSRGAGQYRSIAPRLSISRGYAPCREAPPPADGTVPLARCAAMPAEAAALRTLRRVSRTAKEAGVEPSALHATALIDLLWGGTSRTLDRSIQALHTAARLSDAPAPLLADLAGAYLLRAERMQTPGDLDRALEAAEEAFELDSANTAALYNRALALERIGLAEAADDAWRAYLRADDDSGWADEARGWLRHTVTVDVTPPAHPTPAAAASFARRMPQQANAWGWETLLPAWAAARQAGHAAAADSALRLAEVVGAALVSAGRDATLADAVAVLRAADPAATDRLARAHRTYGEARRLYEAGDRPAAEPLFARAAAEGAGSATLQQWARLFGAAARAYADPKDAPAEQAALRVAAEVDSIRHPALAGRARWIAGSIISRKGGFTEGRSWLLRAASLLQRAGEDEHQGAVEYLAAYMLHRMGNAPAADQERHAAMLRLRAFPRSIWRHGLLYESAERAREAQFPRTALHYHGEDIRIADRTGLTYNVIEARLGRARLLLSLGRGAATTADLTALRPAVAGLESEFARDWFGNDLRVVQAEAEVRARPDQAAAVLDSVIDYFQPFPARLLPALLVRADARLAAGRTSAARADLHAAADVLIRRGAEIRETSVRGALFQQARHVFDRLVLADVAAGEHARALRQLEHVRAVFAPFPHPVPRELQMAKGTVGVEYALIGDTLLTWTVEGRTMRMTRRTVSRAALVRTVEQARSSLELREPDAAARQPLAALYDLLVRPLHGQIDPAAQTFFFVADGPLAGVPFAALYDRERGRYLVEDRTVRLSPSLASPSAAPSGQLPARALVIADPAFDRSAHPGLDALPGAAAEAAVVARLYPTPRHLRAGDADQARISEAAAQAELVHFAGHAVLDDARPERSFLLLSGSGAAGMLTAEEIGAMDLRHVRLVVLSACETAGDAGGRSGGLAGLSAAFMGAGTRSVVGSLWRVDDGWTRALMVAFHDAYRTTGDAPSALRAAQLALLRSSDPRLRSPAAWAGFVSIGN
jgi:CHAT domain-containing protein